MNFSFSVSFLIKHWMHFIACVCLAMIQKCFCSSSSSYVNIIFIKFFVSSFFCFKRNIKIPLSILHMVVSDEITQVNNNANELCMSLDDVMLSMVFQNCTDLTWMEIRFVIFTSKKKTNEDEREKEFIWKYDVFLVFLFYFYESYHMETENAVSHMRRWFIRFRTTWISYYFSLLIHFDIVFCLFNEKFIHLFIKLAVEIFIKWKSSYFGEKRFLWLKSYNFLSFCFSFHPFFDISFSQSNRMWMI